MNQVLISVIVPTFNRAQMACDCVAAVLASYYANIEVIVVDDCSADDTPERIRLRFGDDKRVHYHRNESNKQLGASRNVGARLAKGKYLLFLDDDNLINPDAIGLLVQDFEEHPEAGLIAPMAVNVGGRKDGLIWTLGCDFNHWTSSPRNFGANLPLASLPKDRIRFPTLYSPNAFAVPAAVHRLVGGFCEELPFYFDESDYGWRICETGRKAWILSTAVTMHQNFLAADEATELRDVGLNATWRAFRLGRNRIRFARRHFNVFQILSVMFVFAPISVLYYGRIALRNHRPDIAWTYLKGTIVGILGL